MNEFNGSTISWESQNFRDIQEITLSSSIVYGYVMKEIVEESTKNYFPQYSREVQDILSAHKTRGNHS